MSRTAMLVIFAICAIVLIIAIIALVPRIKNALAGVPLLAYIGIVLALAAMTAILAVGLFGPKGTDSLTSADVQGVEKGDAEIDTDLKEKETGSGTQLMAEEVFSGSEIGDDTVYIRIRGDEIHIGAVRVDDVDTFAASMAGLMERSPDSASGNTQRNSTEDAWAGPAVKAAGTTGRTYPVCLIDDYATSRTYTAVRDVLDNMGIEYTERAM